MIIFFIVDYCTYRSDGTMIVCFGFLPIRRPDGTLHRLLDFPRKEAKEITAQKGLFTLCFFALLRENYIAL